MLEENNEEEIVNEEENAFDLEEIKNEKQETNTEILSHKKTFYLLLKRSFPITVDNIIVLANGFLSNILVKQLGSDVVAADSYIGSFKNLLLYPSISFFYALEPMQSRVFALNNYRKVGQQFWHSIVFGSFLSMPIMVALGLSNKILTGFGQHPDLASLTLDYFKYQLCGLPAVMATESIFQFLITTQNEKYLIPFSLVRTGLELGLIYLFINYSPLGIAGWGIASALQSWLSFFIGMTFLRFNKSFDKFELFDFSFQKHLKMSSNAAWQTIRKILKLGSPIFVDVFIELFSRFTNVLLLGANSKAALAAYGIGYNYFSWIIAPLSSLSITSAVLVANARAKNQADFPIRVVKIALLDGMGFCLLALPFFIGIPRLMTKAFLPSDGSNNEEIMAYGEKFLPLLGVNADCAATKYIATGGLRGYEETKTPMLFSFLGIIIVGLVLSAILVRVFDWDIRGTGIAEVTGMLFTSISLLTRFAFVAKKNVPPAAPSIENNSQAGIFSFFRKKIFNYQTLKGDNNDEDSLINNKKKLTSK